MTAHLQKWVAKISEAVKNFDENTAIKYGLWNSL
jgi:hypothetical protein